jgi:hypothetical protein
MSEAERGGRVLGGVAGQGDADDAVVPSLGQLALSERQVVRAMEADVGSHSFEEIGVEDEEPPAHRPAVREVGAGGY